MLFVKASQNIFSVFYVSKLPFYALLAVTVISYLFFTGVSCVFQKVIEQMSRKAFFIAKEIVESEETFIQVLRLLNEVCNEKFIFSLSQLTPCKVTPSSTGFKQPHP